MGKKYKTITLGPSGSFSHLAVLKVEDYLKRKENAVLLELDFAPTILQVFQKLTEEGDFAVIPLENSEVGSVGGNIDHLISYHKHDIQIIAELDLIISHHLVGFGTPLEIRTIYTHPLTQTQCEHFLEEHFPEVEIIHTNSNSDSAARIAMLKQTHIAAIVPKVTTEIYHLPILFSDIQNRSSNTTRFVIITTNLPLKGLFYERNSLAKSTIVLEPQNDYPGLLCELLSVFARRAINLSKIESRPSRRKFGEYLFYLDIQADFSSSALNTSREELLQLAKVKFLGTYYNLTEYMREIINIE